MKNLLNPKLLLVINTLPICLLFIIFVNDYNIIKTLLTEENIELWKVFGLTLLILAIINLSYSLFAIVSKKSISIYYGFTSLVTHIIFIYQYSNYAHDIIPTNIPGWMISGDLFMYVGTFLMPTLAHALFVIVIKFTSSNKTYKAWQNVLISLSIPLLWYIFFQIISPFWRIVNSGFGEHILIITLIIGVILFLFFLIRGVYILSTKKDHWKKHQLIWKIPIGIILPLFGLLVNNGLFTGGFNGNDFGIFGNFNSFWFYTLAIINGILICLPNTSHKAYRLVLFIARTTTFTYTLYFFVVFLPFLPLSVIAIIALGAGILMLTPLVLFVIHIQELATDFSYLKQYFSKSKIITLGLIGLIVIPTCITVSYKRDKIVLHDALDYIYNPNYSKTYAINKTSLKKTLNKVNKNKTRRNDFIKGNQTPYLSTLFNWIVLDNLTLSNAKINTIEKLFFNKASFNLRTERLLNKEVTISKITSKSTYNQLEAYWESWVDMEITNANTNNFISEYATTINLPNGCWINDYYLYVGDRKEMGMLSEKKSAMWIFSQIRRINRDPGLLHYLTGNEVSFRVFPFAKDEVRRTGIKFIHKEPTSLKIDNHQLQLGPSNYEMQNASFQNDNVAYVSAKEKYKLLLVERKPYYHFVLDISEDKANLKDNYIKTMATFLDKNPLNAQHKISFTNIYTNTTNYNDQWQTYLENQTFEGGFYLERAIKKIYVESFKTTTDRYPIIIVVTDDMLSSIISKDFKDFKMTFPEHNFFYHLNTLGYLASHDLTNRPKRFIKDDTTIALRHPVLAWPNTNKPLAYLPNTKQSNIILKSSSFVVDQNIIQKANWESGLLLQSQWLSGVLHPEKPKTDWNQQVKYSFMSNIMTPLTAYIVVENDAQKAILKKK